MILRIDESVFAVLAVAVFLVAIEVGFRLGLRHRARTDDKDRDHFKTLQTALLGLLSLLLGFNFAMAAARFDARKSSLQDEVNAINTSWRRAQLLPLPQRAEVSELLRDYVAARIAFTRAGTDETLLDSASEEATRIDTKLWDVNEAMFNAGVTSPQQLNLFTQALNEMMNVRGKRRTAFDNHVPEPVLQLLFTVAVGAFGFIGYAYGLTGTRRYISTAIYAVLVALVLATILDFDRPRGGFIRVSEDGMERLQASFAPHPP